MNVRHKVQFAFLATLFLAWHVPLMYRIGAGQDEDWYAVPGITILRTGLPQIPYIPARDPGSACFKADVILDTLPPLGFYLQAAVELVLGKGLGQARMASALAGLAACYLVYDLACTWFGDRRGALIAAAAYLLSRAFYFPATTARPDMAAVALGLLALRAVVRYRRSPRRVHAIVGGIAAGLSLLAHPFGIVPTTQAGLALLAGPGDLRARLRDASIFSIAALLIFSLWLPLISLHPDIFRAQFIDVVLNLAGHGLEKSALTPWSVLGYQLRQVHEHMQSIQAGLYASALAWATLACRKMPGSRDFAAHLWASWLLLFLFEGRHPTLGYYAYPAALTCIALGALASRAAGRLERASGGRPAWLAAATPWLVCGALLLAFLPGAGLRTLLVQLRHLNDPAYDAHALARAVMDDIPSRALTAVDEAYVLDFYLAGRPVLDATIHPFSYDVRTRPFEYIVFGRRGMKDFLPLMNDLILIRTYGDRSDPFAPYAELHRRARPAAQTSSPGGPRSKGAQGIFPRLMDVEELFEFRHPHELDQVGIEAAQLDPAAGPFDLALEVRQDAEGAGGEGPDVAEIEHDPPGPVVPGQAVELLARVGPDLDIVEVDDRDLALELQAEVSQRQGLDGHRYALERFHANKTGLGAGVTRGRPRCVSTEVARVPFNPLAGPPRPELMDVEHHLLLEGLGLRVPVDPWPATRGRGGGDAPGIGRPDLIAQRREDRVELFVDQALPGRARHAEPEVVEAHEAQQVTDLRLRPPIGTGQEHLRRGGPEHPEQAGQALEVRLRIATVGGARGEGVLDLVPRRLDQLEALGDRLGAGFFPLPRPLPKLLGDPRKRRLLGCEPLTLERRRGAVLGQLVHAERDRLRGILEGDIPDQGTVEAGDRPLQGMHRDPRVVQPVEGHVQGVAAGDVVSGRPVPQPLVCLLALLDDLIAPRLVPRQVGPVGVHLRPEDVLVQADRRVGIDRRGASREFVVDAGPHDEFPQPASDVPLDCRAPPAVPAPRRNAVELRLDRNRPGGNGDEHDGGQAKDPLHQTALPFPERTAACAVIGRRRV
jgi:hypothetical protein